MNDRLCARESIRHMWQKYGITYKPLVMAIFALASGQVPTYREALDCFCEYAQKKGWGELSAEQWHAEICRHLLGAGIDMPYGADAWIEECARDVAALAEIARREEMLQ